MRKILDLLEQSEDDVELNDYETILALNKKKIDPSEVVFYDSKVEDYNDIIEVTQTGLVFTFDGLDEFLQFFFKDSYGEEGSEGWYEAEYLNLMYQGRYDYDFWDRSSEDWNEGVIVDSIRGESLKVLYQIIKKFRPGLLKGFKIKDGIIESFDNASEITNYLEILGFGIEESLQSAFVEGSEAAVMLSVPQYIEDSYCNGLSEIGIEKFNTNHCFYKYKLSWGPAIMLFVRYGTSNDSILDLMFQAIETEFKNHTGEYYEIQYNAWDNDEFTRIFDKLSLSALNGLLESLEEISTDERGKGLKYLEIIDFIDTKIGFGKFIPIPGKGDSSSPREIAIVDVDRETLNVKFKIKERGDYNFKMGSVPLESIINILNIHQLFDPMKYRVK